jgi:hypothetical protein
MPGTHPPSPDPSEHDGQTELGIPFNFATLYSKRYRKIVLMMTFDQIIQFLHGCRRTFAEDDDDSDWDIDSVLRQMIECFEAYKRKYE